MKTKEELTAVKEKAEAMNEKVRKLTDEELHLCSGGIGAGLCNDYIDDFFKQKQDRKLNMVYKNKEVLDGFSVDAYICLPESTKDSVNNYLV